MSTVWVLFYEQYNESDIEGIYDTEEKAIEGMNKLADMSDIKLSKQNHIYSIDNNTYYVILQYVINTTPRLLEDF